MGVEKHLLGLLSFPPLSVQALVKTLRLPESCSHIPPPHFTQKGRCGGGGARRGGTTSQNP